MHIGRSGRYLPQRGRFECAPVLVALGHQEPPRIGEALLAPGDAGIVIPLIGEIRAEMTGSAITLAPKNL